MNSVSNTGSTSPDDCICNQGYEKLNGACSVCAAGKEGDNNGGCQVCLANTFSTNGLAGCLPCPTNTPISGAGSDSADDCSPCRAGTEYDGNGGCQTKHINNKLLLSDPRWATIDADQPNGEGASVSSWAGYDASKAIDGVLDFDGVDHAAYPASDASFFVDLAQPSVVSTIKDPTWVCGFGSMECPKLETRVIDSKIANR